MAKLIAASALVGLIAGVIVFIVYNDERTYTALVSGLFVFGSIWGLAATTRRK